MDADGPRRAQSFSATGSVCSAAATRSVAVLQGRIFRDRKRRTSWFVRQIRDLGVLQADEQIEFFYPDALVNIENGFYLLTDRNVVVYSRDFEEPAFTRRLKTLLMRRRRIPTLGSKMERSC